MRGWIYVASARGDPGRVRIGHSSVDPLRGAGRADGECLQYDVVVDAPAATVELVHARLRSLRTPDGRFRCSPEFAIAAIHHALGGPPAGERVYAVHPLPADDPAAPPPSRRGERGGTPASLAVPAAGAFAAIVFAAWMAARGGAPFVAQRPAAPQDAGAMHAGAMPLDAAHGAPGASAPAAAPAPPAPPRDAPAPVLAPTSGDCAALESLLARCAALRSRGCERGTAALAAQDRRVMTTIREAGRAYDAGALENFCRAACRQGYRPAHADFAATVCHAPR